MINIAIITGGPSAEREVALQSAALVENHLDRKKYNHWTILLEEDGWYESSSRNKVDLNDFSILNGDQRVKFDFVFLIIHGTPAEDGKLQGYFEHQGIPHSTCNTLTCALTFNKQWCKDMLATHEIPMASSQVIRATQIETFDSTSIAYPVFVKPNNNGSSYGVNKVASAEDMHRALEDAARYDDEIMIEEFISGREFSCGVVRAGDQIHTFPLTEMIPEGDFFDYAAKYEGAGREVTPAEIDPDLADQCKLSSRKLYTILNCRGIVRFDYILANDTFQLLEVNTIPGLSEASIIPQQARAYGWSISRLLDVVIQEALQA